ncbi:CPBP family intramembrane glutamic endopeptidase [Methanolapillus millepedarum]|uniref:CAAX prenyl protease 2/Lysostaphin resistance protein A-like domain-containing protein n=1 Tax=Methanolapillus millepedarum TaxID=3028296 RepID=A0AA96V280_9EURY|nr:hypothetical protein MsAc7_06910 [Methanosarcinaceae archaeon Ac7]
MTGGETSWFKTGLVQYFTAFLSSAKNFGQTSVFGFAVLIQLFLFLSARYIWNAGVEQMFLYYMVMLAFSYALLGTENPLKKVSTGNGIIQYLVAFIAGLFVFSYIGSGIGSSDFGGFGSLSALIICQSLMVGMSEEMLFRGAIPRALQASKMSYLSSRLISVVSFALFHAWAYNWNWTSMIASACFGALMQYVWDAGRITKPADGEQRAGYPLMAIGFHAAWNVAVISPFMILFGMV